MVARPVHREDVGGKFAEHVLESLGGSRDQTVVNTYLGKIGTVRDEVGSKEAAEHVLESLNYVMKKEIFQNSVLTWGAAGTRLTPTAPPGSNSAQLASRTGCQLIFPVKNPFCQAQTKYC